MELSVGSEKAARTGSRGISKVITRILVGVLAVVFVAYFGISAYVADKVTQPSRHPLATTPAQYGLKFNDVQFTSTGDNVSLKGWFMPASGKRAILMMHGKGGTREDKGIGMMDLAKAFVEHGYNVMTFDFRGHGESGGTRYALGQFEVRDVAGALNYLKSQGMEHIGTIAFSMGAATEISAAPDHPEMQAIVADSAFADLSQLLDVQLPKNSGLPAFFNPGLIVMAQVLYGVDVNNNKPERQIAQLGDRPILLIHSSTDELIPINHLYELQKAGEADKNLQVWVAPGSGHVQAFKNDHDEYLKRVFAFYDANLK